MKSIFIYLGLVMMTISSCTTIQFETSQPQTGEALSEFPKFITGKYSNKKNQDTLLIFNNSFQYLSSSILGQVKPNALKHDEIVLKKLNEFYVLSLKDSTDAAWEVFTFRLKGNYLQVYYLVVDEKKENKVMTEIKGITKVIEIKDSTGNIDKYLINPTNEEFQQILDNKLFSKIMEFKKLK